MGPYNESHEAVQKARKGDDQGGSGPSRCPHHSVTTGSSETSSSPSQTPTTSKGALIIVPTSLWSDADRNFLNDAANLFTVQEDSELIFVLQSPRHVSRHTIYAGGDGFEREA